MDYPSFGKMDERNGKLKLILRNKVERNWKKKIREIGIKGNGEIIC